jgi:guanine nucleotide exchange factor
MDGGLSAEIQGKVLEALKATPRDNSSSHRTLSSFDSFTEVVEIQDADTDSPKSLNRYDLLCPRTQCKSVILKAGVGKLAEKETVKARLFAGRGLDLVETHFYYL